MRVSVRFNEVTDKDIIDYLNNCKDKTKGVKSAMRSGLVRPAPAHNDHLELIRHDNKKNTGKVDVMANLMKSTKKFTEG